MEAAGASFVRCEAAPDLGDDVDVLTVWSSADFVEWNRIRRNLMFDPAVPRRTRPSSPGCAAAAPAGSTPATTSSAPGPTTTARRCAGGRCSPSRRTCRPPRASGCGGRCATATGSSPGSPGARSAPTPPAARSSWSGRPPTSRSGRTRTTYMTHPYHAALLDRFLLPDCPERITTHNTSAPGSSGTRSTASGRSVRWRCGVSSCSTSTTMTRPAAPPPRCEAADDGWSDSILAANTMATRWFDGETDLGGTPEWTHVWDQCFRDRRRVRGAPARRQRGRGASRPRSAARVAEVVYVPEELHRG